MTSRFVNLFKKNDLDEQRAFQRKVHGMLGERFPDRLFTLPDDPLTLESEGTVFGLTNLRSNFLLSSQNDADLRKLIENQFPAMLEGVLAADRNDLGWSDAAQKLMPQLMPSEFLEKMDLVSFPFGDNVEMGFVIDSDKSYSYVRHEELDRWGVTPDDIRRVSIENLNIHSKGIEMMAIPGENAFFVINTMDGFDAVRIVVPEITSLIAEHIGSPFFTGVPNRDFLICWSGSGSKEFQDQMRNQVSADFDQQPYPLSRNVFEVSSEGEITLAKVSAADSRAITAENN